MSVRLQRWRRVGKTQYRLTPDVIAPDRPDWNAADCQLQVDLWDEPTHRFRGRRPLVSALDLYQLVPGDRPDAADAALLWQIGEAVQHYVQRMFDAGIPYPFAPRATADTPEQSE